MERPSDQGRSGPGSALPPHLDPRGRSRAGSRPAGTGQDLPPHLDPRGRARSRVATPAPPAGPPAGPPPEAPAGPEPRRRGRRVTRVLSWVALGLSVVVFAVAALGWVFFQRYDGRINRLAGITAALPGTTKPAPAPHDARNVLLVGSDTRDTTGDEFQGTGAEATSGQRSDTIILAHLYGTSDQAQLLSFPRDSWVTIPAYTDPANGKVHPEHQDKINSAITEGGPQLLVATVEKLTDIRVDNYVQIDFAGFQSMVQKLGGVEVCLLHPAKDHYSGIDLPAGRQVVNGAQALAFVRQRHGLPNGDLDRIKRQQAFIASVTRKALSSGTLLNPVKLNGFLDAATSSVQVDDTLSGTGITDLALRLRHFNAGGVQFTTVPVADADGRRAGQSVVLLDDTTMQAVFGAIQRDESPAAAAAPSAAPSPAAPAAPALTVTPAEVRVQVYNASGVAGLGKRVTTDLAARGFTLAGAAGNRGTGAQQTVVRYGPSRADAARTLAAAVPGAVLQADPSLGRTVELLAGSSYSGTVAVSVAPAAPAAPAPTAAGPAAPAVTAATDGCVE